MKHHRLPGGSADYIVVSFAKLRQLTTTTFFVVTLGCLQNFSRSATSSCVADEHSHAQHLVFQQGMVPMSASLSARYFRDSHRPPRRHLFLLRLYRYLRSDSYLPFCCLRSTSRMGWASASETMSSTEKVTRTSFCLSALLLRIGALGFSFLSSRGSLQTSLLKIVEINATHMHNRAGSLAK